MQKFFLRSIYSRLLDWRSHHPRKPLILRGARQTGKTFFLKSFAREEFSNFHYLNFEEDKKLSSLFVEELNPEHVLQQYALAYGKQIDLENDLIIFDEIQACPDAITSLKYFCERYPNAWVIAAGSLLGLELSPGSYPVGKVDIIDFAPLTFSEFLEAIGESDLSQFVLNYSFEEAFSDVLHKKLWRKFNEYLAVGGLPECVEIYNRFDKSIEQLTAVREKQRQLIRLYSSDFSKHSGKENAMHIERVFHSMASQLAQVVDGNARKFKFKGVVPNKRSYSQLAGAIDWLEKASLVHKCFVTDTATIPLKAYRKENRFKLYSFDVGVLGALAEVPFQSIVQQDYGSYKGFYAENFVAQELLAQSSSKTLFSWVGRQSEIEFLKSVGTKIIPIEVKAGKNTRSRSLSVYKDRYHPKCSAVFYGGNDKDLTRNNTWYVPLYLAKQFVERFCS